ncbi:MAG: hypothetical protein OEN50_02785, partial [Deltaproteobacteria bacterium]|nr:hypothetical protein [Deltaproteobacteria bacterium]
HRVVEWNVVPMVPDEIGWPVLATDEESLSTRRHIERISNILNDDVATLEKFHQQAAELMLPHAFGSLKTLFRKEGLGPVLVRLARLRRVDLAVVFNHIYSSIRGKSWGDSEKRGLKQ